MSHTTTSDLFAEVLSDSLNTPISEGAYYLKNFAFADSTELLREITNIAEQSPFRVMLTPRGKAMSVAMTNCGSFGWVSDQAGYRYSSIDPLNTKPWPEMPDLFMHLATEAAKAVGFEQFRPDACLINRYQISSKMGLHQDKDEQDMQAPIVSVSLGISARFAFGGESRDDQTQKIWLNHGDVVVWGGCARKNYHGILTLKSDYHPTTQNFRFNLTFRKAM